MRSRSKFEPPLTPRCRHCGFTLIIQGPERICPLCDWWEPTNAQVRLLTPEQRGTPDPEDVRLQDEEPPW
jgi:hypothetical protein